MKIDRHGGRWGSQTHRSNVSLLKNLHTIAAEVRHAIRGCQRRLLGDHLIVRRRGEVVGEVPMWYPSSLGDWAINDH